MDHKRKKPIPKHTVISSTGRKGNDGQHKMNQYINAKNFKDDLFF